MSTSKSVENNLIYVILFATLVRIVLIIIFQPDWNYINNPDEHTNYFVAKNYLSGHGYSLWDARLHDWIPTSFHSTFTVFVYVALQVLRIPVFAWILFVHVSSVVLYAVSGVCFFQIAREVLYDKYAFWATVLYLFFPSTVLYIGPLFLYENIVVPFLIISIWHVIKILYHQKWSLYYALSVPMMVTISILLRPNIILIYILLFSFLAYVIVRMRMVRALTLIPLTVAMIIVAHIPIVEKNYNQFGAYILSTQAGFEMLQGHNPTARGSWMGTWQEPGTPLYEYTKSAIPDIGSMNEYQESKARQRLAIRWILQNPLRETLLDLRKLAIYFMPKNYDGFDGIMLSKMPQPINASVYVMALLGICILIYKRQLSATWIIYIIPLLGSILISIVFFVGFRWRFYAEPFMCILAIFSIQELLTKRLISNSVVTKTDC